MSAEDYKLSQFKKLVSTNKDNTSHCMASPYHCKLRQTKQHKIALHLTHISYHFGTLQREGKWSLIVFYQLTSLTLYKRKFFRAPLTQVAQAQTKQTGKTLSTQHFLYFFYDPPQHTPQRGDMNKLSFVCPSVRKVCVCSTS